MQAPRPPSPNPFHLADHERQRCEVWTRIMGYHRPVSEFNPGKQSEHRERRHFGEPSLPPAATRTVIRWPERKRSPSAA
jgi:hypothetical protein